MQSPDGIRSSLPRLRRASCRRARAVALGLALCACRSPGGPPLSKIAAEVNSTLEPESVVLDVGDRIAVRFPYAPDWNQETEISPDGSASFMGVGRLIVSGMSPGQLNQALSEAYALIFEDHELDVAIESVAARNVYVMGEVKEPGAFALDPDRRLTLLDALARAGGPLKESAYLEQLVLVRWSAGNGKQLSWTIDASEEYWTGPEPLYLQPYDLVYIPNTPVDDVAIWVDNYIRRMLPFPYIIPPIQ